jgi:hypothetical protein
MCVNLRLHGVGNEGQGIVPDITFRPTGSHSSRTPLELSLIFEGSAYSVLCALTNTPPFLD